MVEEVTSLQTDGKVPLLLKHGMYIVHNYFCFFPLTYPENLLSLWFHDKAVGFWGKER